MKQRMGMLLEVSQTAKQAENRFKSDPNSREAMYHFGQSEAYKVMLERLPEFFKIAFHAGFSFSEGMPVYENGETEEAAFSAFIESERK